MRPLDEKILRCYFRIEEAQRQRLWMERLWHPEHMKWTKRGAPPPTTETKRIRLGELSSLGFGEEHYQAMVIAEKTAQGEMKGLVEQHPLWPYLSRVPLFSWYLSGAFIAAGGDIERCPTVSSFWRGMGLDLLPGGVVPRRVRGRKDIERRIPCLPHVSRIGEQIRQQLMKGQGHGYALYKKFRAHYDAKYPDRPKLFNHKAALRNTQKLFYAALWKVWREAYGLPAPEPYAFAILEHTSTPLSIEEFCERPEK